MENVIHEQSKTQPKLSGRRVLVLCSAGLDSVVAAAVLKDVGQEVTLFFIDYGSLASDKEKECIEQIAFAMELQWCVRTFPLGGIAASGLMGNKVVGDLAGKSAWVPARNLILISLATAYAVSNGYEMIAHGNIADGIYPDNKPAFTTRLNHLMPYAVGENAPTISGPVNHLTKEHVVLLGDHMKLPFHLTWSCYKSGNVHCGTCGSCVSRRRAFARANVVDLVPYAE